MIYTDGVHLVADTYDELHAFAKKMGLKREWFQQQSRWPHYDLTTKRALNRALKMGVKTVASTTIINIVNHILQGGK